MIEKVEKIYLLKALPTDEQIINYKITYEDGKEHFVPDAPNNRHYKMVMEWVEAGNTIIDNPPEEDNE